MNGSASGIIKKIIEQDDYYPNLEEIKKLKEYIFYQRFRTVDVAENLLNIECKASTIYLKKLLKNNIHLSDKTLLTLENEFKKREKKIIPQKTLNSTSEEVNSINDLDFIIINYKNTKNKLISSDNPVIFYNIFSPHSVGLLNAGLIIMLPINPDKMIILFDSKMYPRYKNKKIVTLINEKEVQLLNAFQIVSAKKIVYFKSKEQASNIQSYINNSKVLKNNTYYTSRIIQKEEFINFHYPHIDYVYEFSFCKLHPKAKKISIKDYDFITRMPDELCEQIMKGKQQVTKDPKLSNKLLSKKIKDMEKLNKFIYDYWNDKL